MIELTGIGLPIEAQITECLIPRKEPNLTVPGNRGLFLWSQGPLTPLCCLGKLTEEQSQVVDCVHQR